MNGINGIAGGISSFTGAMTANQSAAYLKEKSEFAALMESLSSQAKSAGINNETLPTSATVPAGRLNGDYTSGFEGAFAAASDKKAAPQGAAANSASAHGNKTVIDKTSKLYEKSLEMESYFVKIMLNSMKSTLSGDGIGGKKSYAQSMYEDMLYDEMATAMTKNAGFGIADQIYLQLV